MTILRCTQKLLQSGVAETAPAWEPSAAVLGDWYANVLFSRPQRLVVCVSEQTRLPVVLPLKPAATLASRLPGALAEVLLALGIDPTRVRTEVDAMQPVAVGRTANRQILGQLNQFLFQLELDVHAGPDRSLVEQALWLAGTPCSTLEGVFPDRVTRSRLA